MNMLKKHTKLFLLLSVVFIFFLIFAILFFSKDKPSKSPDNPSETRKDTQSGPKVKSGTIYDTGIAQEGAAKSADEYRDEKAGIALKRQPDRLYEDTKTYESPVFKSDFEFNAVFPLWKEEVPRGTSLELYIRTGSGESWGSWTRIYSMASSMARDDISNDEESVEAPVFAIGRQVQYKAVLKTTDKKLTPRLISIRFYYMDSRESALGKARGFLNKIKLKKEALASPDGPKIISRADWGCPEPTSSPRWAPEYANVKKFVIHHTAMSTSQDPKADLRAIWDAHANAKGWGDIGYNYILDKDGNIYEGRYGGNHVVAGHTLGYNRETVGVSVMGDFSNEKPSQNVINTISYLIGSKAKEHGINPSGSGPLAAQPGKGLPDKANMANIDGHNAYNPFGLKNTVTGEDVGTECPANLQCSLPCIRELSQAVYDGTVTSLSLMQPCKSGNPTCSPPKDPSSSGGAGNICSIEDPSTCKNCNMTELKRRMSCLGMWGVKLKNKKEKKAPTKQNKTNGATSALTSKAVENIVSKVREVVGTVLDQIKKQKPDERTRGGNRLLLQDKIDNYLGKHYPASPFRRLNAGKPGELIVSVSYGYDINPLILLGVAATATDMGQTGKSMDCGNPWRQKPPTEKSPVCIASDGSRWYEYNKDRAISDDIIYNQAERIAYAYAQDYKIRDVEQFIDAYNKNNPLESGQPNLDKELFAEKMNKILDETKETLSCFGSSGDAGGDLANADALDKQGIQCVLDATGNGYNLDPYVDQIYEASHMFNLNPLFTLAIANKDSSLGTAGAGRDNMNPGNISYRSDLYAESGITAKQSLGDGRWAVFDTYGDGFQAKTWLLRAEYLDKEYDTIEKIVFRYAPPTENDSEGYVQDVETFMEKYGAMCGGK